MREISVAAGDAVGRLQAALDAAWVLSSASLVLLMLAGFTLVTCGLVRRKNAAHLVMLNLAAFVFSLLAYYAVGFALEFGGAGAGTPAGVGRFLIGTREWGFVGGHGFFFSGQSLVELRSILADDQCMSRGFFGIAVEFELESIGQQCLKHLFELLGRRG